MSVVTLLSVLRASPRPLARGGKTMACICSGLSPATALFSGAVLLGAFGPALAQSPEIGELKGKIFDAKMAQQTFSRGLRHCAELDGSNFYLQQRDRVLNLEEYHRSLTSLAAAHVFNPETKRPWSEADADARWEQVKKQALTDKANCALVASLPELEKKLDALQGQAATQGK
jgi:hypothetical protein